MDVHVHHTDPDIAPEPHQEEFKQCQTCRAKFPASHYGLAKYSRRGVARSCNECSAQTQRINRRRRGSKSKVDDSILRSVLHHNTNIIDMANSLSTREMECRAFNVSSKSDYKVFFGRSASLGLQAVCIFSIDGSMLREFAYSGGLLTVKDELLSLLKVLNLRLELTEVDVIASKTLIYYL